MKYSLGPNSRAAPTAFAFLACVAFCASPAVPDEYRGNRADDHADWVLRCEEVFPDIVLNPDMVGGIFMERYRDKELACIFGTLASDDIPDAGMLEGLVKTDIAVTMSPGGPVETWLKVGRSLMAARPLMIVDRICASSCANYISPIADEILAVEGSLVIWHGGPGPILAVTEDQADRDLQTAIQAFMDSTAISDVIFTYSSQPASEDVVGDIQRRFGDSISHIDGYALSPDKLRRCFGYKSVDQLWHPGGNREVYLAGTGLNRGFLVLENPGFDCE